MVLEAIARHNDPALQVETQNPQAEQPTYPQVLHVALVVPDVRLYQIIKQKFRVIQPPYANVRVQLHVLVENKDDPHKDLDWQVRVALIESGLAQPADAHLTYPDQVTLGWPTDQETP